MLMISVPRDRVPDLSGPGHKCSINGHKTLLRLDGQHLTYEDDAGTLNRCKLLSSQPDGGLVHYMAASHGDDDERHHITRLDHNGLPVDALEEVSATHVVVEINGHIAARGMFHHADIDGLLAAGDKMAGDRGERPSERAIHSIVTMMERGKPDGKAIITTALWAVCRRTDDPEGAQAIEDIARQGGSTISVEIKTDAEGFEFRGRGYPTPRVVSREQARRLRQLQKQRPDSGPEPAA